MGGLLTVGLVGAIVGTVVVLGAAIRDGNRPAMVNAIVVLLTVLVPVILDWLARVSTGTDTGLVPDVAAFIGFVGVAHAYGMLGPYDTIWWWDHLTHTLAAAVVAGLLYAGLLVSVDYFSFSISGPTISITVIGLTLFAGVLWELIELLARDIGRRLDAPPVLEHYGRRDTILDICFDTLGAVFVVAFDLRVFVQPAESIPVATVWALGTAIVLLIGGSLLLSLFVVVDQAEPPS